MKKQNAEKQEVKPINAVMSEQVQRIKANYRVNLSSKYAIINESCKTISAALRSGIKSLLINKMSDVNVDMMTILFIRTDYLSENFDKIPEKFAVVRNGEFVQLGIDNYLLDDSKVANLDKVSITMWYTDTETFETKNDSIIIDITNNDSIFGVLFQIFDKLSSLI